MNVKSLFQSRSKFSLLIEASANDAAKGVFKIEGNTKAMMIKPQFEMTKKCKLIYSIRIPEAKEDFKEGALYTVTQTKKKG